MKDNILKKVNEKTKIHLTLLIVYAPAA